MNKQLLTLAALLFAAIPTAHADETGLASIHEMRHEKGRRVCMTEHFHDGSGTGKTRKAAEEAAKESWVSFTVFEYGTDWGSYTLASSQTMECSNIGDGYSCATQARPCKRYVKPSANSAQSASR